LTQRSYNDKNSNGDLRIEAIKESKGPLRWFGVYFDSRLSFKQ
jgi:hypothetical protein